MPKAVGSLKVAGFLVIGAILMASAPSASAQNSGSVTGSGSGTANQTPTTSGLGPEKATPIDRSASGGNTNQAENTGFVGASSSQNFVGGTRQATQNQGQNRQFQAFQPSQTTQSTQTQTGTPRQVRTSLRMAFAFPAATIAQQTGTLSSSNSVSLSQFTTNRPELAGINVDLTNTGEAVLTGTVASTEASRLAANLVRLQPGVRKVNNQLGVGQ